MSEEQVNIFGVPMVQDTMVIDSIDIPRWYVSIGPYLFRIDQIGGTFDGVVSIGGGGKNIVTKDLQENARALEEIALPSLKNLILVMEQIKQL